jgi:mannan endo-1,4-beta-mannosidase
MKIARSSFQGVKACLAILLSCLLALGPGQESRVNAAGEQGQARPTIHSATTGGFHISGRTLLDANGKKFVMRGINHPHNWYSGQTSSFQNIKATGANTIRVVLSNGHRFPKNSVADVANVISLCKANKLVCILEVHDTTGYKNDPAASSLAEAVAYWKEIKSVLIGQEAYVMINIGNEPWGNIGQTGWITDTKNAILDLRNAGFQHTLIVDAPYWGQDTQFVMRDNAAGILASDPAKNTIFSVHMYGGFDSADKVEGYLSKFANANLPLIIGEFGYRTANGGPDEDTILQKADAYQIGYLAWSWSGNSNPVLDMVTKFDPNQETWWGNRIIRGANGICQTSAEASVYGGSGVPVGCGASPTISGNVGVGGVVLSYTDTTARTVTSNGDGSYSFQVPNNWSGTVTPTHACYTSNPTSLNYSNISADQPNKNYTLTLNPAAGCTGINVSVGGSAVGGYYVSSRGSMRTSYPGGNNGPAKVSSTNNIPVITSQMVTFGGGSYSEMMGLPFEQLSTEYLFPYYNNVAMDSQLRVSNVGGADTTIKVYLGADPTPIDSYTLAAGGATRKNYSFNSGPLRVTSSASNILATIRVLYANKSYSELMGFPASQLSKEYLFPYYNNVAMDSQLRVSNVGGADTTITVYLGTEQIDQYTLAAGGATRKNYPGKNSGPLRVTSSDSNILTTIRVLYAGSSLSELMGFPVGQLSQSYWYPVYDNATLDSQLRVSNVGSDITTITVYTGTEQIDSYELGKGAAVRRNYPRNTGPLHVVSSTQPILTTVRLLYGSSLYEMTGLPQSQLSTQYFFPWYNNYAMNSELRFAVP